MNINGYNLKIVGMTRVQNAGKYLIRLLQQYSRLCDNIIVLDDKSTDNTKEICSKFNKVEYIYYNDSLPSNWQLLWKACVKYNPDFVLGLDGDELFDETLEQKLYYILLNSDPKIDAWTFPFFYLWDSPDFYRVDNWYNDVKAIRVFRYKQGLMSKDDHRHITAAPEGLKRTETCDDIRIKHFGYMLKEDRDDKYNYYINRDKDLLEQNKVNYAHFAPDAKYEVKHWSDWKSSVVKLSLCSNWVPGGYLQADICEHPVTKKGCGLIKQDMFFNPETCTLPLESNSIDGVYIEHVLERSGFYSGRNILKEIYRILKPGGQLEVKAYNFTKLCEAFLNYPSPERKAQILKMVFGSQKEDWEFQTMGFDEPILRAAIEKEGFETILAVEDDLIYFHFKCYKKKEEK